MTNVVKENQHWVPKLMLRHFTDQHGKIYFLDKQTDKIGKRAPKFLAAAPGFNNHVIDGLPISFEDEYGRIETLAAPILRRVAATSSLKDMTESERRTLADFLAAQNFRTQAFQNGLNAKPDELGKILKSLWDSHFITSDNIHSRGWTLIQITGPDVFYLGDNPAVLQRTANPKDGSDLGIDVPGVELAMPISPKLALYLPCQQTTKLITDYHEHCVTALQTGYLPPDDAIEAGEYIIRSQPIYQALTTGKPFTATPEQIENLNYLQCSWAAKHVFSNQPDFTFAKRVFSETPQYRKPPQAKIVPINVVERARSFK